ncbi:hypothetical protein [Flammeovirga kamogawensis]|uniref:OmpH family outer membrane protein n=1 Tax=Flammeovirga kamogawensis TaxID=373891 RepID=A0ABX8GXA8_9BACT|nr:hypothetical protein [Flammeovirga kamogawensis]MBB6460899.1 hypothetical protein [Flammeovirga kamogawensis]QWG08244.1 hypothetical protein KM029_04715 [Flammeovirga kamogawensis]TRX70047.1 hypothetical protein EO216_18650 [Flammeovirga kamogawensis]
MKYSLFLFTALLLSHLVSAQELANKDQVLERLMLEPKDTLLWECYVGKSWNSMTIFEKEQITELANRYTKEITEHLAIIEQKKRDDFEANFDAQADSIEMTADKLLGTEYLDERKRVEKNAREAAEASIAELKNLSQNMSQNLPLIEDEIKKRATALDIEYEKYSTNNGEDILNWVKQYGQSIYKATYNQILVKENESAGE